jgi:hypothetical protein
MIWYNMLNIDELLDIELATEKTSKSATKKWYGNNSKLTTLDILT